MVGSSATWVVVVAGKNGRVKTAPIWATKKMKEKVSVQILTRFSPFSCSTLWNWRVRSPSRECTRQGWTTIHGVEDWCSRVGYPGVHPCNQSRMPTSVLRQVGSNYLTEFMAAVKHLECTFFADSLFTRRLSVSFVVWPIQRKKKSSPAAVRWTVVIQIVFAKFIIDLILNLCYLKLCPCPKSFSKDGTPTIHSGSVLGWPFRFGSEWLRKIQTITDNNGRRTQKA